jgi:hypothetical protein
MNIASKAVPLLMIVAFGLGCGYSKPNSTMPAIAQLNPGSVTAGSAAFQLEVDGTSFVSGAVVNFNGVAEPTTFVSSTKVEASIPASAVAGPATVTVTVTNPGSGGIYGNMGAVTTAPMNFMVN